MPLTHKIKIAAAARGGYSTTGAVAITAANPMKAAGVALLDGDTIQPTSYAGFSRVR